MRPEDHRERTARCAIFLERALAGSLSGALRDELQPVLLAPESPPMETMAGGAAFLARLRGCGASETSAAKLAE
jgi:hypothetical protein